MRANQPADATWRREPFRLVGPMVLVLVAACATGDPLSAQPGQAASVETLIGDAACDSDAQCHTIALGAKACGGPQRYLAWSSSRTDGSALRRAAEREARAARAQVEKSGMMSNCAMVTDPGAYCLVPRAADGSLASSAPAPAPGVRQCRLRATGIGGAGTIY